MSDTNEGIDVHTPPEMQEVRAGDHSDTEPRSDDPVQSLKNKLMFWKVVVGLLVVGLFIGLLFVSGNDDKPVSNEAIVNAAEICDGSNGAYLYSDDGGTTLIVDVQGDDESVGASYVEAACVLNYLKVPESVQSKMGSTPALDGMLDASWDGYVAEWNYHPDNGLNLVIEATS